VAGDELALAIAHPAHRLELVDRLRVRARHGWQLEQIKDLFAVNCWRSSGCPAVR
jgi:hypothetical protein